MGLLDPTAPSDSVELSPLSERVDTLEGKRIGLYDNGKLAAGPVLEVVGRKLAEKYPEATISEHEIEHMNYAKDPDVIEGVRDWAREEIDVCIGAIGDCGSCTKFLVWGMSAVEDVGVPAVGLIDAGFELDWRSNAIERGRPLRYRKLPVQAEVRDTDRISKKLTPEEVESMEEELTRPLSSKERGFHDSGRSNAVEDT